MTDVRKTTCTCCGREMNAAFSTPHFISLLIEYRYLQPDQGIPVLRTPIMITDADIDMVQAVLNNKEYYELPVVYVAKDFENQDPLSILKNILVLKKQLSE